ncbi:MAG: peptidase E [Candidatus Peregrinibacteria bacterium]|nr:peptidase E [Candidatus Peregrinibacteria bacterium]
MQAKKIITIGGGNHQATAHIDREIVRLSGKKKPKLLFIPTASSDDTERYVPYIEKIYGELGCTVESLLLLKQKYSKKQLSDLILGADIIYVGGGNTLMMMRKWRHLGVNKLIKKAWQKGTVMCGLSAGSICWYESGHSDSMYYYDPKNWDYVRVRCLNLIPFIHCPHYDSQTGRKKRKNDFKRMLKKYPGQIGLACDDGVALEFIDDKFRVLSATKDAHAYRAYWKEGKFYEESLSNRNEWRKINELNLI